MSGTIDGKRPQAATQQLHIKHVRYLMTPTFAFSPDSFWLRVPKQGQVISVRPFVSSFGETDELLCYVDETLLGKLTKSGDGQSKAISLLPTLERTRTYPWPVSDAFLQALLQFLRDEPNAVVSCERDTDQDAILQLAEYDEVVVALSQVVEYCKSGSGMCPTFLYQKK